MTKRDLDRIAYLTAHADGMAGGLLLASQCPIVLLLLVAKASPVWIYLAGIAASLLTLWLVGRFIRHRVGRVVLPARRRSVRQLLPIVAGPAVGGLWKIDNDWLGLGMPSLTMILAGAIVLWFAIRDWPFRSYRFAIPIVALPAALAHMGVVTESDLVLWRTAGVGTVIVTSMIVGILDYLTLVRMLGATRRTERSDAQ